MAEMKRPEEVRLSVVGTLLKGTATMFVWMVVAAILSVIVEWTCMWFEVWDARGALHSQQMLNTERQYLLSAIEAVPFIKDKNEFVNYSMRVSTIEAGLYLGIASEYFAGTYEYALASVNVLMVFVARLFVLSLSLPAFIVFGTVGVVRGLVARDLRKWGGGRETSGTYHLALRFLPDVTVGLWAIYLAMPISINPFLIVGPVVIAFAMVMSQLTYRFKKYV